MARLAADPVRPRVYATVPSDNSVIVIDTTSLAVVATIPIGSSPQGLAVSADRQKLWVANSGSTNHAVGVIDLNTLTTLPSLPAPNQPYDIEEGLAQRLYLTPLSDSASNDEIMQIDGATGAFLGYLGSYEVYSAGLLKISPDRRSLFFGNRGLSPSTLDKFDVSRAAATLIQQTDFDRVGSNGESLRISHNGKFLVFPNGGGNKPGYSTIWPTEPAAEDCPACLGNREFLASSRAKPTDRVILA